MLQVNEYFEGKVKSFAIENNEGTSTIGVMVPGEYEFSTSKVEFMTIITGEMTVLLPNESNWKTYKKGETFKVEKDNKFQVKIEEETAYQCLYK